MFKPTSLHSTHRTVAAAARRVASSWELNVLGSGSAEDWSRGQRGLCAELSKLRT